jgi:hypothetical protein
MKLSIRQLLGLEKRPRLEEVDPGLLEAIEREVEQSSNPLRISDPER